MMSILMMTVGVLTIARTLVWISSVYLSKHSLREVEIETLENELHHLRELKQLREKKRSMENYGRHH